MKLLVVAAWEPELEHLRARLAGAAEERGLEVVFETLGVGLVEAAIAMTQCIVRHAPTGALLIGTCGGFGGRSLAPALVVAGESVRLADGTPAAAFASP